MNSARREPKHEGGSPDARREGGQGRLGFALGTSSLGQVLVAASERGVCAILMGDDAGDLLADLGRRFPGAELVAGGHEVARLLDDVLAFLESPQRELRLPLDVRGTAFQRRVWHALRGVPAGRRLTYAELAARMGVPGAARAVAGACAANAIAVAIPCHRVVRGDGGLAGYRWGVARKRALLAREAALLGR